MSSELDGLRALVTGGASGIGLATARLLAARGARVVTLDRDDRVDRRDLRDWPAASHDANGLTGSRAFVTAKVTFHATMRGKPITEEGTWTFVAAKSGTAWKITSMAWGTLHH